MGVCLFRLVTGGFPSLFRAGMSDGLYLHLVDKEFGDFWKDIDNYRIDHNLSPLTNLSDSFKDLIVNILAFDTEVIPPL